MHWALANLSAEEDAYVHSKNENPMNYANRAKKTIGVPSVNCVARGRDCAKAENCDAQKPAAQHRAQKKQPARPEQPAKPKQRAKLQQQHRELQKGQCGDARPATRQLQRGNPRCTPPLTEKAAHAEKSCQ